MVFELCMIAVRRRHEDDIGLSCRTRESVTDDGETLLILKATVKCGSLRTDQLLR
jgi:hypothetical protein